MNATGAMQNHNDGTMNFMNSTIDSTNAENQLTGTVYPKQVIRIYARNNFDGRAYLIVSTIKLEIKVHLLSLFDNQV